MKFNILGSLFMTFIKTVLAGITSMLITTLLFSNLYEKDNDHFLIVFLLVFLIFFISGLIAVLVFLPIALFDRKKIEKNSHYILLKRYLPFFTLPLASLFMYAQLTECTYRSSYYDFMIFMINTTGICYVGIWSFIKHLKN